MEMMWHIAKAAVSAVLAWISARMGILLPVLILLVAAMILDYISGMAASKYEAIEHPENPVYGWSSKKGAQGILKKVGYLCVIAVAMILDYVVINVSGQIGIEIAEKAFFGLLVSVWYILNEALSIIENVGRMGKPVPSWLARYIAVLKNNIDERGRNTDEDEQQRN